MALVKPFRAYRPVSELAKQTASLPYDVLTTEEAREEVIGNPYSFLHVDKAEIDLEQDISLYDERVYKKAAENLGNMISSGQLEKDAADSFYIYRQEMDGRCQTGLVALTSIDEYLSGVIKKHELTRENKENDRVRHIEYCAAHTSPIFIAYKSACAPDIKSILNSFADNHEPVFSFEDGVKNTVWVIDDATVIDELVNAFAAVENLYIADGHHRNAAATVAGLKMRAQDESADGSKWYNYNLAVVFPDDELCIMPYNRVIRDLNGRAPKEFISAVSELFDVEPSAERVVPAKRHEFGMFLDGRWYRLMLKQEPTDVPDALAGLGVTVIHSRIIEPLLGVYDLRNDQRIDFIGGSGSIEEIERRVGSGEMTVGFTLFATTLGELTEIADRGGIMPPKSTWFEPKLRSGLFVHKD